MAEDLIIRIGGEGGEGIISSGDIITGASAKAGFNVYTFKTFPAEIRGGYAMYQLRVSSHQVLSQGDGFDIFVAFNGESYNVNKKELKPGTVLLWDGPEGGDFQAEELPGVISYTVPMSKIAKEELKTYRSKNMVALGAISSLFSFPIDVLKENIAIKFGKKGQEVVDINIKAIDLGKEYVEKNHKKTDPYKLPPPLKKAEDVIVISGNYAVGLGALAAGVDFFSAYPITPATEVAIMLAQNLPKMGGTLVQVEDEIASIGNIIGASYAGAKSMTATSGPGLSLMTELLGLASIAEIPIVLVNVQRGGPSTGLPTKHEQSDLFTAIHGGHGDMSRIVLAVDNVEDCFYMTVDAFNLAEKYQVPVILLSDGSLGFRTEGIKIPDTSKLEIIERKGYTGTKEGEVYKRYEITEDLISPMSKPGQPGGNYIATGLEHGEVSKPIYTPENHVKMMKKRFEKLDTVEDEYKPTEREGAEEADLGIISWGSTQGAVREAMQRARADGLKVAALYPKLIFPLPEKAITKFAKSVKKVLVPEINYQGQFAEFIRSKTGIECIKYNIYGGMPFQPGDIHKKMKEIIEQ